MDIEFRHWVLLTILALCGVLGWVYRAKVARLIEKIEGFYREVKTEMRKVAWPTKDEVIGNTIIVLITATALGLIIATFDWGLGKIVQIVFSTAS